MIPALLLPTGYFRLRPSTKLRGLQTCHSRITRLTLSPSLPPNSITHAFSASVASLKSKPSSSSIPSSYLLTSAIASYARRIPSNLTSVLVQLVQQPALLVSLVLSSVAYQSYQCHLSELNPALQSPVFIAERPLSFRPP